MRSFLKYAGTGLVVILLIFAVTITAFLFRNKAPIISGNIQNGIKYKNDLKLDLYGPTKKVSTGLAIVRHVRGFVHAVANTMAD